MEHGSNRSVEVHIPTWKKTNNCLLTMERHDETWYLKLNNSNRTLIPIILCFPFFLIVLSWNKSWTNSHKIGYQVWDIKSSTLHFFNHPSFIPSKSKNGNWVCLLLVFVVNPCRCPISFVGYLHLKSWGISFQPTHPSRFPKKIRIK